jgi:hypothetical protein
VSDDDTATEIQAPAAIPVLGSDALVKLLADPQAFAARLAEINAATTQANAARAALAVDDAKTRAKLDSDYSAKIRHAVLRDAASAKRETACDVREGRLNDREAACDRREWECGITAAQQPRTHGNGLTQAPDPERLAQAYEFARSTAPTGEAFPAHVSLTRTPESQPAKVRPHNRRASAPGRA